MHNTLKTIEDLEPLLIKLDKFIAEDPELSAHGGNTIAALFVLGGGMFYSKDNAEKFEEAAKHAVVLMKIGFEYQKGLAELEAERLEHLS